MQRVVLLLFGIAQCQLLRFLVLGQARTSIKTLTVTSPTALPKSNLTHAYPATAAMGQAMVRLSTAGSGRHGLFSKISTTVWLAGIFLTPQVRNGGPSKDVEQSQHRATGSCAETGVAHIFGLICFVLEVQVETAFERKRRDKYNACSLALVIHTCNSLSLSLFVSR